MLLETDKFFGNIQKNLPLASAKFVSFSVHGWIWHDYFFSATFKFFEIDILEVSEIVLRGCQTWSVLSQIL